MTDDRNSAQSGSVAASISDDGAKGRQASRRELFTAAGASLLLAVPMSPAVSKAARDTSARAAPSVIVIGGGFCGVTAARELGQRGYDVTLLEARNRLGGRTFTAEFAGEATDMGGTWIHWQQPHVWSEMQRYGLKLKETPGAVAEDIVYLDYEGRRHETRASKVWADLDASVARLFGNAYETMPRPAEPFADDKWVKADTYSIQQKLDATDLTPEIRILLDTWCTLFASAPAKDGAWIDLMRLYALCSYNTTIMNDATARYKIEGGTRSLLDAIAAEAAADVRLSTPVKAVRQLGDKVEVVTEEGVRLTADAVVVAVPMNVLKDIAFIPALSAPKLEASRQTHSGNGTKVHVLLDKAYPMFSGWAPTGNVPLNFVIWEGVKDGQTHLIGLGPSAETLDVNDTSAVQTAIQAFVPGAQVVESYSYEWGADPYSQGVWCFARPGQMSKFLGPLQGAQGRVHFANADWASGWRGFIDGAIEQGVVAARHIHQQLDHSAAPARPAAS